MQPTDIYEGLQKKRGKKIYKLKINSYWDNSVKSLVGNWLASFEHLHTHHKKGFWYLIQGVEKLGL